MEPAEEERQKKETRLRHFAAPKVPSIYDQTGGVVQHQYEAAQGLLFALCASRMFHTRSCIKFYQDLIRTVHRRSTRILLVLTVACTIYLLIEPASRYCQ